MWCHNSTGATAKWQQLSLVLNTQTTDQFHCPYSTTQRPCRGIKQHTHNQAAWLCKHGQGDSTYQNKTNRTQHGRPVLMQNKRNLWHRDASAAWQWTAVQGHREHATLCGGTCPVTVNLVTRGARDCAGGRRTAIMESMQSFFSSGGFRSSSAVPRPWGRQMLRNGAILC